MALGLEVAPCGLETTTELESEVIIELLEGAEIVDLTLGLRVETVDELTDVTGEVASMLDLPRSAELEDDEARVEVVVEAREVELVLVGRSSRQPKSQARGLNRP